MKIVLDMNLARSWVPFLAENGIESVHWSEVGDPRARDEEIMSWAREHGYVVFTQDLDFTVLLALTKASGPSVIQIRNQDTLPETVGKTVVSAIREHEEALENGALISVNIRSARVRILPIGGS